MTGRKPRWIVPVAAAVVLLLLYNATIDTEVIGGKWLIVKTSGAWSLPEAGGGSKPNLHRRRLIGTRQVDELVKHYNYIGDDCVVYVTYYHTRIGLRAACGDHPPIVLSDEKSGIDWLLAHPQFRTDPIQIGESTFVSVAEVKKRAIASR
jgi:hypothetical protein